MAYWKLITNGSTTNTANMVQFRQAIAGVIGGTYGTLAELQASGLSGALNLAACTKSGTNPTSNMYQIVSQTSESYNSSWVAHSWNIQIKKWHYAKNQVSGFDPYHHIRIDAGPYQTSGNSADGAGFRLTWENSLGSAKMPTSNRTHFWGMNSGAARQNFQRIAPAYAAGGSQLYEIHIILNDTTFFFWTKANSSSDSSADVATWMASDFEFDSVIDTYHHSINNLTYPGSCTWTMNDGTLLQDPGTAIGTDNYKHVLGTGRAGYLREDGGGYNNTSVSDENTAHQGPPQTYTYAYHWPHPWQTFGTSENAAGPVHFLHPVSYNGNLNVTTTAGIADPRIARLMNVYRTTDNLDIGERIKVGSDYYVAFRTNNGGAADPDTADQRMCYAFPENNVPY